MGSCLSLVKENIPKRRKKSRYIHVERDNLSADIDRGHDYWDYSDTCQGHGWTSRKRKK